MSSTQITQGIERDFAAEVQTFDTRFLVAMHHGEIDVVKLAREQLMNRGIRPIVRKAANRLGFYPKKRVYMSMPNQEETSSVTGR